MSSDNVSLCCCEYLDIHQQRNHILACCCNCYDLDEGFESLITGQEISSHRKSAVMATIQDRMRIPWRGGAKQITLDTILPIVFIPTMLLIASISLWWTIFSFSTTLVFLLYVYHHFTYSIPHTKFFVIWVATSVVFLYIIFEFLVIPFLLILFEENIGFSCLLAGFIFGAYLMKVQIGKLRLKEYNLECDVISKSRTYNCSICRVNIPERGHHCFWLDCCISYNNRFIYLVTLALIIGALLYGSNLMLTSVCHPFHFYKTILLPDDCSEVYEQFELGLAFVTALYCLFSALAVMSWLGLQCWLVTIGITGQEFNDLPLSKKMFFGLNAKRPYSRGIIQNWLRVIFWFLYNNQSNVATD